MPTTELWGRGKIKLISKMEELRKVEFIIQTDPNLGLFDASEHEHEEIKNRSKTRIGYFHGWTDQLINEDLSETTVRLYEKNALIEDLSDGQIYKVKAENLRFTNNIN